MKPVQNHDEIMSGLGRFFVSERFDDLYEAVFTDDLEKVLLFPADDVFLTKDQFDAVISLLREEEKLYLLNFGYDKNAPHPMNDIYELADHSYEEYYSAYDIFPVQPLTMLFSDSFRWVVVIDENIESGMAVLAADKESIVKFKDKYMNWQEDIKAYEEFCRKYNYELKISIF